MAIKLNEQAVAWAKNRIEAGEFSTDKVVHESHANMATDSQIDRYFNTHSEDEIGQWFLGVDTDYPASSNKHWVYPAGDFSLIHKENLETALKEAKEKKHKEIAAAAEELLKIIH